MSVDTTILDAGGRVPAPLNAFEARIARETSEGVIARRLYTLTLRQALPLEDKIALSLRRIREWHEAWSGDVSVSYSGGKDSSVLLWLVRSIFPEVPAVFINTGLEYPEVVRHVQQTPNHVILRPAMNFKEVLKKHGWPMGSKKIARGVNIVRHPTGRNQNVTRLYLDGVNRFGLPVNGFKIARQWRFLFQAPFECSDKCCDIMKKKPQALYAKESGRVPFVGTMASDSKQRQRTYLQSGQCNGYDMKNPHSAPMSFWTEQDVLACIQKYQIPIPAVYGQIVNDPAGGLATTGVRRTGCVFCCFGLALDEGPKNRFELLAQSHPTLHRYVMERLGLGEVLAWCRANAPARLAGTFRGGLYADEN